MKVGGFDGEHACCMFTAIFSENTEHNMRKVFMICVLLVGGLAIGCDGNSDGPAAGQTHISWELSGGHLEEPLTFEGNFDVSPSTFDSSTNILARNLDLKASNGTAVLRQFVFSPEIGESGTYASGEADFSANLRFPDEGVGYQLHDNPGDGTFTLDRSDAERVIVDMDFEASPSNIGGRDLVFHLKGVIDSRK